jgi:L-seryl-tRNA(Ser) seleniumtransferase
MNNEWGQIYKSLGATPIINAIGSVTMLGGSTPVKEVKEAMELADSAYIPLMELEEKAGSVIADLLNVPATYITSGAGSALTLATAALMAGDNDDYIQQLPDTTGMKNQILIQKRQHYWYDRCLELAGAKLVDFGSAEKTTKDDLERAINENTLAVHYYAVEQSIDPQALTLEDTLEVAKKHNIPVMVDAAGQIYPLENLGKYVRMGADFQCIAAKYIGAPQSTGLALGTKDMIYKLSLQSFVGYEGRRIRGVGRPQKVDRQEMIGVVAAVKRWMSLNHEDRLSKSETMTMSIINGIKNIPSIDVSIIDNVIGHMPFGLRIKINSSANFNAQDLVNMLKAGDPPIWTRVSVAGNQDDFIDIHMFGLNDGEDIIVSDRINSAISDRN